jgi:hypothetical protein
MTVLTGGGSVTVTYSGYPSVPGGGSGTVTNTAGTLTVGSLVIGNGNADIKVLAVDPTNCTAGQVPTGIDKTGAAKGCTAGTGTVTGPGTSVNSDIVLFNGTTGNIIKDSGVLVSGLAASNASTTVNGTTCTLSSTCTVADSTKVPTTTTVNGHALSSNVVVSGSDITTGLVPLANGGTGINAASVAALFNGLAPATAKGGLIVGTGLNTYGNVAYGTDGQCVVGVSGTWAPGNCATGAVGAGAGMTTNKIPKATASLTLGDSSVSDDATKVTIADTGGLVMSVGPLVSTAQAAPTGIAGSGWLWYDTTATRWLMKNGSNTAINVVASGVDINTSDQVTATHLASALPAAQGGTANAFFAVAGPAASVKTFTFPNSNANVLTDAALVTAAQGGTGTNLSAAASGRVPKSNGAGAFIASSLSPAGNGTCTNQVVTAENADAAPTCTTLTSAFVNSSIALTGTDINTSNQVTATHLASPLPSAQGGTANAFFTVAGPATSAKTFTFPNASANVLTDNAAVTVLQGGTGATTASAAFNNLSPTTTRGDMIYQGATGDTRLAVGTTNQCLTSNGTDPAWGACTTGSITGAALVANQVTYASGASAITSNSGLTTDSSGNLSANSLTITGTGGGNLIGIPATTVSPTLVTSAFNLIAPNAASITNYAWQPPTGENGTAGIMHVGAASTHISQLTIGPVNLAAGGDVTGTTSVPNGGTGNSSFTTNGLVVGNGTSSLAQISVGATGTLLTGVTSNAANFSGTPTIGSSTIGTGTLGLAGGGSGTITIQPQSAAGTYNFNLPTTAGSAGQCLTSAGGGTSPMTWGACSGSSATLDQINNLAVSKTFVNGNFTMTWQNQLTTASASANTFTESAASTSTGTPFLVNINTLAASTLNPLQVTALGTANGVRVDTTGLLSAIGTGNINATQLSGKVIAGAGAAIPTGPSSVTSGRIVSFSGTAGQIADSGTLIGNVNTATLAATAANQVAVAGGASRAITYVDFPEHLIVPAANCNNATAGAGWSIPATNAPTIACRAGTNNLGGVLQWANNNTTTNSQFVFQLPFDWDTATQPYWNIVYGSGTNTTGTIKWTISTACTKSDGSVSDDPAFVAETTSTGKTMAVANRMWSETGQFANLTSGNNCVAGSTVVLKVTSGNGTATATVNVAQITLTVPRLITVQAN